ncbi:MAG: hypothetical protein K9N48_00420 [Verrucomicrobia bacterium]|nr:hypothetical protein [Verrucomicrobiota bacterium]
MKTIGSWLCAAAFLSAHPLLWADAQWLNYHTSEHAREVVGGSYQVLQMEMETEAPADMKLPELSSDAPQFFKWTTAMDPAGFRWMVFDKTSIYSSNDILYIDTDGDGQLDDEQKIKGRRTSQYNVEFGAVPVYFEGDDGTITYHLNLRYYCYNRQTPYVYSSAGCWYQGNIDIGGKTERCMLLDYNCNGAFNDKPENFDCDRIILGSGGGKRTNWVGNYIEIARSLYRLKVAEDGAFLELQPAPDTAYGVVTMPDTITSFSAAGTNGMFEHAVDGGEVSLPEGYYRIRSWEITREDELGVPWTLRGTSFPPNSGFTVAENAPVNVDVGEPFFSQLTARNTSGNTFYFNQNLYGKSGESISLRKAGVRPEAPGVRIWNKSGEYDRNFSLEYG